MDLFANKTKDYQLAAKCLGEKWADLIGDEFSKTYMKKLSNFLVKQRKQYKVYPDSKNVFRAFQLTDPDEVKVVMVGQDPYPHKAADGLAFSSCTGRIPPSLKRIYDEIKRDTGEASYQADLTHMANQGVLLLNKSLTVRASEPRSHHGMWENFVGTAIKAITKKKKLAVIAFGNDAQAMLGYVHHGNNPLIIKASHPARQNSYALNLKGKGYFKQIEDFVENHYNIKIDW